MRVDIEQMRRLIVKPSPQQQRSSADQQDTAQPAKQVESSPLTSRSQLSWALIHQLTITSLVLPAMFTDPVTGGPPACNQWWRDQINDFSQPVATLVGRLVVEVDRRSG